MKKCTYCGRKFLDDATECTIDQNPLVPCDASSPYAWWSMAAPAIWGIIIWILMQTEWMLMFAYLPIAFALLFLLPPSCGLFFAITAGVRRESKRLTYLGLAVNLVIFAIYAVLVLFGRMYNSSGYPLC